MAAYDPHFSPAVSVLKKCNRPLGETFKKYNNPGTGGYIPAIGQSILVF